MSFHIGTTRLLMIAFFTGSVLGCSKSDVPPVGRVTGQVTKQGNPVAHVLVQFFPNDGRPSSGATNAQGQFELIYSADIKGAMVGEHKVFLTLPPKGAIADADVEVIPGEEKPVAIGPGGPPAPKEWPQTIRVEPGDNRVDFSLDILG